MATVAAASLMPIAASALAAARHMGSRGVLPAAWAKSPSGWRASHAWQCGTLAFA